MERIHHDKLYCPAVWFGISLTEPESLYIVWDFGGAMCSGQAPYIMLIKISHTTMKYVTTATQRSIHSQPEHIFSDFANFTDLDLEMVHVLILSRNIVQSLMTVRLEALALFCLMCWTCTCRRTVGYHVQCYCEGIDFSGQSINWEGWKTLLFRYGSDTTTHYMLNLNGFMKQHWSTDISTAFHSSMLFNNWRIASIALKQTFNTCT